MDAFLEKILALQGIAVYAVVGALVFAEDAVFVGFLVPGETAAVLGGVAASRNNANVVILTIIVIICAVVGDSLGYAIGARYGDRLAHSDILARRARRIERASDLLRRRGGIAVVTGRFVAFLRAIVPFLAGTSHMRYRTFLSWNVAGAIPWGIGSVLLGYLAGNSFRAIEKAVGPVTAGIVALLFIAAVIAWGMSRHRRANREDAAPDSQ